VAAPLNSEPQPSRLPTPAGVVPGTGDPATILLVDDQPGRLLTYRAILEPLGERLIEARSGEEALRCLMQEECALILLDVNMPGMDGFETASLIHQHPRYEQTPIIFVTAVNVSDMDRMRGYKLGAVDYVMVPVIPEILRSKVMVLAELYRKRRELQVANASLAAANADLRAEKTRELALLNDELREANNELARRNVQLQLQIGERELAQARLLKLDRRKDEFLATLAHELRNPLASLSNAVNVLQLSANATPGAGPTPLLATMQRQPGLPGPLIDPPLGLRPHRQAQPAPRRGAPPPGREGAAPCPAPARQGDPSARTLHPWATRSRRRSRPSAPCWRSPATRCRCSCRRSRCRCTATRPGWRRCSPTCSAMRPSIPTPAPRSPWPPRSPRAGSR